MIDYHKEANNQGAFIITALSYGDLEEKYDINKINNEQMNRLANKMANAYMEGGAGFWGDLEIIADDIGLPRLKKETDYCPKYNEQSLPDKNGDCSLCRNHKADSYKKAQCKECNKLALLSDVELCPTCTESWVKA